MNFSHLQRVVHQLTGNLQPIQVETCRQLLPILKSQEQSKIHRFLIGDVSWSTLEFHHSMKWSLSRDDPPQKASDKSLRKFDIDRYFGNRWISRH
jgi:hypothetical protein